MTKPKISIFTGAGISAESGIMTFRDGNGLWENHRVEDVATPSGWFKNPKLVLDFYNSRRKQLKEVEPNEAHLALRKLENFFEVTIITQNVDNLHERANSSNIIHLHGELNKVRCSSVDHLIASWDDDLCIGDICPEGHQLRPHIVWFGEAVPNIELAIKCIEQSEIIIIIGTSLQVYPAAGIIMYAPASAKIYYIDPNPTLPAELFSQPNVHIIKMKASKGVPVLVEKLISNSKHEQNN